MVLNDEGHHAYRPAPVGEIRTSLPKKRPIARKRPYGWRDSIPSMLRAGFHSVSIYQPHPFTSMAVGTPKGLHSHGSSATLALSMPSRVESQKFHDSLPSIIPAGGPERYFKLWQICYNVISAPVKSLTVESQSQKWSIARQRMRCSPLPENGKERFEQLHASTPGQSIGRLS